MLLKRPDPDIQRLKSKISVYGLSELADPTISHRSYVPVKEVDQRRITGLLVINPQYVVVARIYFCNPTSA
jgi:hypothetical protein